MLSLERMNNIKELNEENFTITVEAGCILNNIQNIADEKNFLFPLSLASEGSCTIGGNLSTNAGGINVLRYGMARDLVLGIEVVLANGKIWNNLTSLRKDNRGYDLKQLFIGSEGTLGIATKIAVRITKNPPTVRTLLLSFSSMRAAAEPVSAVIAAGIVPAAMEVMDQRITIAVESFVGAGYPTDAAAVLLVEVEGLVDGVQIDASNIREIGFKHGATDVRVAETDNERELLWKGRKTAFGAIAQIAPDYYLHDTVVPRSALADVLEKVNEVAERYDLIVMNVFHAGDGNLHPLLLFDAREEGMLEKVHAAGAEIMRISLDAGGVLSGEHGIGIEKQAYMDELFTTEDLSHQNRLRYAFDPQCRSNPGKILPAGHSCADIQSLKNVPQGVWG